MPTAQPTITGISEEEEEGEGVVVILGEAVSGGSWVWVWVMTGMEVPAVPEEMVVERVVTGVGVAEESAELEGLSDDCGRSEEEGGGVEEGRLPLPLPVARPVMEARFGALEPVREPTVAYALPSWSAKNGRGSGDSLQQSTCCASALQHHWSSWSLHWVMDSPPAADMSMHVNNVRGQVCFASTCSDADTNYIPYVQRFAGQPSASQFWSVHEYLPYRLSGG